MNILAQISLAIGLVPFFVTTAMGASGGRGKFPRSASMMTPSQIARITKDDPYIMEAEEKTARIGRRINAIDQEVSKLQRVNSDLDSQRARFDAFTYDREKKETDIAEKIRINNNLASIALDERCTLEAEVEKLMRITNEVRVRDTPIKLYRSSLPGMKTPATAEKAKTPMRSVQSSVTGASTGAHVLPKPAAEPVDQKPWSNRKSAPAAGSASRLPIKDLSTTKKPPAGPSVSRQSARKLSFDPFRTISDEGNATQPKREVLQTVEEKQIPAIDDYNEKLNSVMIRIAEICRERNEKIDSEAVSVEPAHPMSASTKPQLDTSVEYAVHEPVEVNVDTSSPTRETLDSDKLNTSMQNADGLGSPGTLSLMETEHALEAILQAVEEMEERLQLLRDVEEIRELVVGENRNDVTEEQAYFWWDKKPVFEELDKSYEKAVDMLNLLENSRIDVNARWPEALKDSMQIDGDVSPARLLTPKDLLQRLREYVGSVVNTSGSTPCGTPYLAGAQRTNASFAAKRDFFEQGSEVSESFEASVEPKNRRSLSHDFEKMFGSPQGSEKQVPVMSQQREAGNTAAGAQTPQAAQCLSESSPDGRSEADFCPQTSTPVPSLTQHHDSPYLLHRLGRYSFGNGEDERADVSHSPVTLESSSHEQSSRYRSSMRVPMVHTSPLLKEKNNCALDTIAETLSVDHSGEASNSFGSITNLDQCNDLNMLLDEIISLSRCTTSANTTSCTSFTQPMLVDSGTQTEPQIVVSGDGKTTTLNIKVNIYRRGRSNPESSGEYDTDIQSESQESEEQNRHSRRSGQHSNIVVTRG